MEYVTITNLQDMPNGAFAFKADVAGVAVTGRYSPKSNYLYMILRDGTPLNVSDLIQGDIKYKLDAYAKGLVKGEVYTDKILLF